jgi:mannose-6-phosphate isomerase-like protein (cupin superfamily)
MNKYETKHLPVNPDAVAPDGSDVRILLGLKGGGMAHFKLAPDQISKAVTHKTVEEIWYIIAGRGQMWRKLNDVSEIVDLGPGVCLSLPLGTHFQFRSSGNEALSAIGITMPPWPGEGEAVLVKGVWKSTFK